MAEFYSLTSNHEDRPAEMIEAMEELVKITGITRLACVDDDCFGSAGCYTDLLEKLATFLPNEIEVSEIRGFTRHEIENRVKKRTRIHIHFNVNAQPYCININGKHGGFEEAFLIQLNNILCSFTQPERFLLVFAHGVYFVDSTFYFSYIKPEIHTPLRYHKLVFAESYGGSGLLNENYPVSDCELSLEEQTDTVIRPTYEVTSDTSALRFVRSIDNVALYDINEHGVFHQTHEGSVPGIIQFDNHRKNNGGQMKLYGDLLYCRNGQDGMFLYDVAKKQFIAKGPVQVGDRSFYGLGEQLWESHIWGVGCTSDDSNLERDGYYKTDNFALDLVTNKLMPMEMSVRHSLDNGRVLLGYKRNSKSLHGLNQAGKIIWTYPIEGQFVSPYGEESDRKLETVFGVYKDLIWFSINSGEIVALSPETGDVKQLLENVDNKELFFDSENSQLINERLRIDLTSTPSCVETFPAEENNIIENNASNIRFWPSTRELRSSTINNRLLVIDDSHAIIGLKDLNNMQYAWQYYLFETVDHGGLQSAKRYGNMLCALDGGSTLHIFEINDQWL